MSPVHSNVEALSSNCIVLNIKVKNRFTHYLSTQKRRSDVIRKRPFLL